jgi:hypothetical protein
VARARNIKPKFFTNEELVELPFGTRLLFIGLWTIADRAGRLEDRPKKIKMEIFPADDFNIDTALEELQASGFLARYEHGGSRYIQVLNFCKHQNPHRDERASTIPAQCEHSASTVVAPEPDGAAPADSPIPDTGTLNPEPSVAPSAPPDARATAADLSIAMRKAGVQTQPADPRLIALAAQGVQPETATAACAVAVEAQGVGKAKPGYVFAILERWAAKAATLQVAGAAPPQARASPTGRPSRHVGFDKLDYSEGIENGRIT